MFVQQQKHLYIYYYLEALKHESHHFDDKLKQNSFLTVFFWCASDLNFSLCYGKPLSCLSEKPDC